jgi:hypothetical protein
MKQVDWIRFDAAATHFCFEFSTICTHIIPGVWLVELAMVSPWPSAGATFGSYGSVVVRSGGSQLLNSSQAALGCTGST